MKDVPLHANISIKQHVMLKNYFNGCYLINQFHYNMKYQGMFTTKARQAVCKSSTIVTLKCRGSSTKGHACSMHGKQIQTH